MIISILKGRLGNGMFQVAAGYALARRMRVPFAVNFSLSDRRVQPYKNTVFRNIENTTQVGTRYNEPSFSYTELPERDNMMLDGYFQTSKYFTDCIKEIKNLFVLPEVPNPKEGTVGVHFRRGDYTKFPNIHLIPSDTWYEEAIKDTGLENVIACTEPADSSYVKNLGYSVNGGSDVEDLVLLSKCEALVMTGSSFSWWAAFLGSHKKVIAPNPWFGSGGEKNFHDIYEKEWIQKCI